VHAVAIAEGRPRGKHVAQAKACAWPIPFDTILFYAVQVIVTCPNCEARYKLSDAVLAKGARLRCAACDHRWVAAIPPPAIAAPPRPPITEADEEAAFVAVQEQMRSRWHDAAAPVAEPSERRDDSPHAADDAPMGAFADAQHGDEAGDTEDEAASGPSPMLRSLVAAIAGVALSVAAAGLWLGQVDLGSIPVLGPALAQLSPPSPLDISFDGVVSLLPSGGRVLEVTGNIGNPGKRPARVPSLVVTLSGPSGPALRWIVPAPLATLPPGRQAAFASTITGFPADARDLSVAPSY
jgi:predicted Zn finger-like uncharacterized protein